MRALRTNIASLQTQRHLGAATSSLGKVYERLSSGLRISRASDDSAGLSVASQLNVSSRISSQGIRNVNDAISMMNIAEGAVSELSNILTRVSELANQSANGVLSESQRGALDLEAQALRLEFNRIIDTTEFNGLALLTGSLGTVSLQTGGDRLDLGFADLGTSIVGDGTFQSPEMIDTGISNAHFTPSDINGDGNIDIIAISLTNNTANVLLGNGDGTFKAGVSYHAPQLAGYPELADLNGDGHLDLISTAGNNSRLLVMLGNGDGSFKSRLSFANGGWSQTTKTVDFNQDGILDVVTVSSNQDRINIFIGNGDGTFKARKSFASGSQPFWLDAADFNGDGIPDIVSTSNIDNQLSVFLGNGDGTFKARLSLWPYVGSAFVTVADVNQDGLADLVSTSLTTSTIQVRLGDGQGTFSPAINLEGVVGTVGALISDLNGDGKVDIITSSQWEDNYSVLFGNGDGTFNARVTYTSGAWVMPPYGADFNNDGVLDIFGLAAPTHISLLLGNSTESSSLSAFSLRTQAESLTTLDRLAESRSKLSQAAGMIGSSTSRLNVAVNVLQLRKEGTDAAASQIQNADIAAESAALTRLNILQQAATSVLAQANQLPALALQLLR